MFSRRPTSAAMVVTILRFLVLLINYCQLLNPKSVCVGHGHGNPHHVINVTSVMHMHLLDG